MVLSDEFLEGDRLSEYTDNCLRKELEHEKQTIESKRKIKCYILNIWRVVWDLLWFEFLLLWGFLFVLVLLVLVFFSAQQNKKNLCYWGTKWHVPWLGVQQHRTHLIHKANGSTTYLLFILNNSFSFNLYALITLSTSLFCPKSQRLAKLVQQNCHSSFSVSF